MEKQLQKYLRDYQDALAQGRLALKQKSGTKALAAFSKAKTLYKRIARSKEMTQLSRTLDQNLANGHYLVGATQYVTKPCKGAHHFWSAYQLVPDDRKVKTRIEQMRLKADQIYREASAEAKVNPSTAQQKAKAALCLVPKTSELYQKLKSL